MSRLLDRLRALWRRLLTEGSSPAQLGAAAFVGILIGVSPFYGLQTVLVVLITARLKLNKLMALATVQISIPPIYPFLVVASLETGNLLINQRWLGVEATDIPESSAQAWALLSDLWAVWLLGSLIVGSLLGVLTGTLIYWLALRSPREEAEHVEREFKESQRLSALGDPESRSSS